MSNGFVDIHCHILPGIDDGARDWEEAIGMAEMAVADGIRTIVATPHQLGNHGENSGGTIRALAGQFQEMLDRRRIPLRVLPGGDVRIEPQLVPGIHARQVLTLADRKRHVLLELPHEVYFPLNRLLKELSASGIVGILSHPERNQAILQQPRLARELADQGCLLQITAGSLLGAFGAASRQFAESLIGQGLVHFVATDAHGLRARRPRLSEAFSLVAAIAGKSTAERLFYHNPKAVSEGADAATTSKKMTNRSWASWFPWISAGEPSRTGTI